MKKAIKFLSLGLILPVLAACGTVELEEVGELEIASWPFASALHQEYMDLAYAERDESDWDDSNYFGGKALAIAQADFELPGPQAIEERDIPEAALEELTAAHAALTEALLDGRRTKPQAAARAQAMFDCWLQEQEEDTQPDDIANCRKYFDIAMKSLTKKAAAAPAPVAEAAPAAAAPEVDAMETAGPFTVYFAYNSAVIDSAATNLIKTLAKHKFAQDENGYIVLSGHTDTSGASAYNDALAEKRSMNVHNLLQLLGVNARILTTAYGEDRTVDGSADGTKSAKNRRVEITLSN